MLAVGRLRKQARKFLNAGTLLWVSVVLTPFYARADDAPAVAGDIAVISGTVTATPGGGGAVKTPRKLEPGGTVAVGDIISTGKDGQIKILLRDRTVLDLGPSSRITVQGFNVGADPKNRQVELNLDHGLVRTLVSKKVTEGSKFLIRTKSATMGVRGTEFVVESVAGKAGGPPKTSISVLQGRVALQQMDAAPGKTPQPPVMLPAGTQVVLRAGDASAAKPVVMQPATVAAIAPQAVVKDRGVDNAIKVEKSGGIATGMDISQKSGRAPAAEDISSHAPTVQAAVPGSFSPVQVLAPPRTNALAGTQSHSIQVTVVHP